MLLDAHTAGAKRRQIAVALSGGAIAEADRDGLSTYLRRRIQRLIMLGEMLAGNYRRLLR